MEDWLIAELIEFSNMIKVGNASQMTDTIKQFLGRKATTITTKTKAVIQIICYR